MKDLEQKLSDAKRDLVTAEQNLATAEKEWKNAEEGSPVKAHYFLRMELAQEREDVAQKEVLYYTKKLFSLHSDQVIVRYDDEG